MAQFDSSCGFLQRCRVIGFSRAMTRGPPFGAAIWTFARKSNIASPSLMSRAVLPAHEGEMGDSAGAAHRLHVEALFDSLQPSPQRFSAPKYDGHHGDVYVIDQVRSQELADGRRAPADADV